MFVTAHLAIVVAAKMGLYKIFLGIALAVAAIKAMVVMAWILAIVRYVPDFWPHYKSAAATNFHGSHYSPHQSYSNIVWDYLSSYTQY